MADVTGDLGGQPIQLNNAATEATLKQLLAAMLAMVDASATGKKGAKLQKELEDELKRLAKAAKSATDGLTDEQKQRKEEADKRKKQEEAREKQAKKEEKAAQDLVKGLEGLYRGVENVAVGMTNLITSMSNASNSLTSAAQSLSSIPVVGGMVATAFGAVAGAAEKTYKSFQDAASVGANFSGSITSMISSATGAGLTFEQFAGIIAKNGSNLALLGGSSAEGAKRLGALGKRIKESGIADELNRMGYSTEDINNGMAGFAGRLAKTGALQKMTNDQLALSTGNYLKNLDAVSKLTGKSKESLQAEHDARMADAQFMSLASKLDADSQARLHSLMDTIPKEHQAGLKEIMATGTATSEAGVQAMAYLNRSGQDAAKLGEMMRSSGKLTQDQAIAFNRTYQTEAKQLAKSPLGETLSKYVDSANGFMAATYETAGRTKDYGQVLKDSEKEAEERKKKEKELNVALDPASMEKYKQKIAETSNAFTALLANSKLLDGLMFAFAKLEKFITTFVVPVFEFVGNHLTLVGTLLGGFAVLIGTMNGLIFVSNALEAAKNLNLTLAVAGLGRFTTGLFAPLAGLFRFAAGLLAAMAPLWPLAVVAGALYAGWKLLENAGYSFTDVLEAMGDNLKRFGLSYVDIWLSIAEKVAKFFGGGEKITQMRQKIELEKAELDEKEKARDQRRKQNREEAAQKAKELDASKKLTESKEEENKQTEKAAEATVDYKNTYSVLHDEFKKRNQLPGATAAAPGGPASPAGRMLGAPSAIAHEGIGGLSAKYESGSKGSEAIGWDTTGGTSYGKYQIATKTGTMNRFMDFLKTNNPEAYERLSKAGPADTGKDGAFAKEWQALAKSGKLGKSEHEFIKKTHYDVGMAGIKDKNLQGMLEKSKALQEVMWSSSVQHGGGGASQMFNKVFKEGMSEQDLIKAVYAERGTKFGSSTAGVQSSVQRRFAEEQQLALGMVGQPGYNVAAAKPTTPLAKAEEKPTTPLAKAEEKPKVAVSDRDKAYQQENAKLDEQEKKLKEAKARAYAARSVDPNKKIDEELAAGKLPPGMTSGVIKTPTEPVKAGTSQVPTTLAKYSPGAPVTVPQTGMLASADSLRMSMEKEAEIRRQAAEKQKPSTAEQGLEILKKDLMGTAYKSPEAKPVQETAETLLASLNTKMDQLIQISSRLGDVNERQLSVQRGLGKDAYAV